MCGLRTRPRKDVNPPRSLDPWIDADLCFWKICGGGGAYRLAAPGRYLVSLLFRIHGACIATSSRLLLEAIGGATWHVRAVSPNYLHVCAARRLSLCRRRTSALLLSLTSRLRSSQILPRVHTRTKRYCSFIQYGLNHYQ